jgi:CheY-like chemotaxis protein
MGQARSENMTSVGKNAGPGTKRRILVVEDNKNIQNALSLMLSSMGFEVALADDGFEAIAAFLDGSFDLVLTDLQMPMMDGSSLAHFIKDISPSTPIILLTGADMETVWKKVKNESIDSVIHKPFKMTDFEKTVQGALDLRRAGHRITKSV